MPLEKNHFSIYISVLFGCIVNKYINNGIRGVTRRVAPNIVVVVVGNGGFGANLDCVHIPTVAAGCIIRTWSYPPETHISRNAP